MSATIRVYVNAQPVDAPTGTTAIDCVRAWRAEEAREIDAGRRIITDSRGLAIPSETPARAGSIFRTVANRGSGAKL
jgi:hypothetical protein